MTRIRDVTVRTLVIAPMLALVVLTGCDSGRDAKLQEDERNLAAVVKGQQDMLQWRLDDAVASQLFDDGTQAGANRYLTFRKCHEEPPTHDANKKVCADLQSRVSRREAKDKAQADKEKAKW